MAQHRQRDRAFVREIPDAYDFRLLGEEAIDGRPVYRVEANPRPGHQPRDSRARILPKVRGTIWIDKAELQWVKADLAAVDTISFGGFLLRIAKGSRLEFEQTKLNEEIWLPRRLHLNASARLALLKKARGDLDVAYSNYRKFQSDTELAPVAENPAPVREPTAPPIR